MNRHVKEYLRKATAIMAMAAAVVLASSHRATAQISVDATMLTSSYSQNFDGMGTSTTASLPTGWKFTAAGAGTTAGWSTAGNLTAVNQQASSGSPASGARYNWGSSTTDRAAGFMTSGSYASPNGLLFGLTNSTTSTITGLTLAFDYERYRINTAAASVTFFGSTDGSTWTAVTAGDSGAFATGANSYTFSGGTVVSKSGISIPSLTIGQNQSYYLKWNFNTTGSNSQGIGLDNFTAAFTTSGGGGGSVPNYYWVGADTTLGGAGTWTQTGGTVWRPTDDNGTGAAWDSTKIATFGGASSGTVTVTDTVNANAGLSFATSGYTLTGGTVSLGGANAAANTITADAATSIAINSVLAGSTGLTKAGVGALTLGGANTYSGGTTVSAGSLIGTTTSLQGSITNSAAVTFDQATDGTYAGIMSGSGSLTKLGAGNVTLSGANTYSGGTTVSAGTLTVGNGSTAGGIAVAGGLDLAAATTLAFARSDTVSFTGAVTGAGTLAQIGPGTLTLSRLTAYGSDFTLRVQNGTVDLNRSGNTLVGILGVGNTVQLAGGTLQLTSNSGEETKFEGAAINVQASSTLLINRTGTAANHSTSGFSAPITVSDSATLAFDYAGVIGSGFKGTTTYSAPITLASNATFSVANAAGGTAEVIFSAAVGDGGAGHGLTKTGPQRLTLSGVNTYTGGTTINAGTLSVAADTALGGSAGGITLGGGTLEMTNTFTLGSGRTITATTATTSRLAVTTGTVSYGGAFTGSGDLDKIGAGQLTVSNASSGYTGLFTISAGTLEVTGANAFANATLRQTGGTLLLAPVGGGNVTIPDLDGSSGTTEVGAGVTAVVGGSGNSAYNGQIRGQGAFKKEGNGILTLNADNDFTGNTRVSTGRLKLGAGGALSATPLIEIDSGAIFDVADKTGGFALGTGQRLSGRGTVLGNLQFGGGSEIAFDSSGPMLVGSGTVSFASGFGIGSIFGLDANVAEGTYTLLNETTGGSISFASLANVGPGSSFDLGGGKSAYFQQGSLQVVVVPEPNACLVGGLCLALFGLMASRRRVRAAAL